MWGPTLRPGSFGVSPQSARQMVLTLERVGPRTWAVYAWASPIARGSVSLRTP